MPADNIPAVCGGRVKHFYRLPQRNFPVIIDRGKGNRGLAHYFQRQGVADKISLCENAEKNAVASPLEVIFFP